VRPASRVARLAALWLVGVTLSIGWLLLRRRTRQGPLLRAVPDLPADAVRQPRATLPAESLPAESLPAESLPAVAAEPEPVPDSGMAPEPAPPHGFATGPEQADDLRRIRGIGRAIESSLHGLGIRSYRQLVMLDEAGLERVRDAGRDFRQRIEREDWIGQARRLHREKYGEEV
jgi:predicted flap endonuclease-1-like 5' DNA nuclease